MSQTTGNGQKGIVGDALAGWPDGSLVARADISEHTFLVIRDASSEAARLRLAVYKRVLPGRFMQLDNHTIQFDDRCATGACVLGVEPGGCNHAHRHRWRGS